MTATTDGLLSVEEARAGVLDAIRGPVAIEAVATDRSLGRVLAAPVVAAVSLPPWDNSAMDGYAIQAADTTGASEEAPVRLEVTGDIAAGSAATPAVAPGTAVRIATGAPVPAGADAVVPVEGTTPLDAAGSLGPRGRDASGPLPAATLVHEVVQPGLSIRRAGSDLVEGTTLLEPGRRMTPATIALAAGAGVADLTVFERPKVAVLATGDEVRAPGEPLGPAGIPDANGPGLRALLEAAGCEPIDLGIARDDLDDVLGRLRRGLDEGAHAVIVSGGVSVGPFDVVKGAIESIGRIDLWRVAVQPGKPFAFGTAGRPDGGAPALVFGLPGNPVSSFVTFELLVRPALRRLAGRRDLLRPADRAVLLDRVQKGHGRRAFVRVISDRTDSGAPNRDVQGRVKVRLAGGQGGQGSHVISALAAADALAIIPESVDALDAGSPVALWWLDET
jgi:molybdopterin molybdotransferase